ncbi:RagB/SusD family nutrient uptake outer membrane protein [Cytophaga sp. FL35]|uniref:RagB/SusD family nutrient uptake outer membrane protein n=1 Tax=Cytophaga sp. FL35 TaxID=1904456 RepID=UPI0016534594|nr:RagB/SusD family nutrient uptake outer membrane protein [Cytophaga sp. FL35]MBC6999828.1 RagB/SusD family nutrient uptake outer membrane protein [Cytophaga sp. FL35]
MNRRYKLLAIIVTIFLGISCEKDLNLNPINQISEDVFFTQENDFKIFTNQFYGSLPGFGRSNRDNYADIGNAGGHPVSNSDYIEAQGNGFGADWGGNYATIRFTTYLINRVQELEDQELKNQVMVYEGEARFFRALAYFRLLKDYGGVPIVDKVLDLNDEDIIYGPRNSRQEVVAFILNDLDAAIASPIGSLVESVDIGRVSKNAALALKARVALFEGTWSKYHGTPGDSNSYFSQAIDASLQVMESGKHSLFDRRDVLGDDSYRYFFILETDKPSNPAGLGKESQNEIILANKFNTTDRNSGYISVNSGNLSPSKKMADMFLDNTGLPITHPNSVFQGYGFDIDPATGVPTNYEYLDRDPRMKSVFVEPFSQFWYHEPYDRKYDAPSLLNTGAFNDGFWTSSTGYLIHKFIPEVAQGVGIDYPVIRFAEVLLIYAEALLERDGSITDTDLSKSINLLRNRVGMPDLTNAFVSTNGLDMKAEIRRERSIELYLEGFRFDDLRRWKIAEIEMSQDFKSTKFQGTPFEEPFEVFDPVSGSIRVIDNSLKGFTAYDTDGFGIIDASVNRSFEDKHYLFPLPLLQLTLNPQLEQNPGWLDGR